MEAVPLVPRARRRHFPWGGVAVLLAGVGTWRTLSAPPAELASAPAAAPVGEIFPTPRPTSSSTPAPSAPSVSALAISVEHLLNATIGGIANCAVRHALCDVSSCTRNADGATASCGCVERPASSMATVSLGWPSAVLAHHLAYLHALRHVFEGADDDSYNPLCSALDNGTVWPSADLVSLWSPNPYFEDDWLTTNKSANCMGAPCYHVTYNSTPAIFNVTCVCPIKYFETLDVHRTSSDPCLADNFNESCAVVTGTWWREEKYEKLTEMNEAVAAADPRPNAALCKNDCEYCSADGDYSPAPTPKGTTGPNQPRRRARR